MQDETKIHPPIFSDENFGRAKLPKDFLQMVQ